MEQPADAPRVVRSPVQSFAHSTSRHLRDAAEQINVTNLLQSKTKEA